MNNINNPINKSSGFTRTEKLLGDLCDNTFLKLWSYLNPFKEDGKELCDLLVVFENHVFVFFDRESLKLTNLESDIALSWSRWKKEVIDKQIKAALGAEEYIQNQNKIYLDSKCATPFPFKLPANDLQIHKVIVAHGARESCKSFSDDNISGSLAIMYGLPENDFNTPFIVQLEKNDCVHILDSHNLEIVLKELDTFYDFKSYLVAKEEAIKGLDVISYCGEEDLLANYFLNYDESSNSHFIGTKDKAVNCLMIGEGEWEEFVKSPVYKRKKEADKSSYFWDELIQKTSRNALEGSLLGNTIFENKNAILEMAKEPRFFRRALSDHMLKSIHNFPVDTRPLVRNISFMPSFYKETGYVFLQIKNLDIGNVDYEKHHRPRRQAMLQAACGVTKNKFPHLKRIVGIGMDSPKFSPYYSEDFILLDGTEWTEDQINFYNKLNLDLKFYETNTLKREIKKVLEFPILKTMAKRSKIGRNEPCPCGSEKKYKKCHGA